MDISMAMVVLKRYLVLGQWLGRMVQVGFVRGSEAKGGSGRGWTLRWREDGGVYRSGQLPPGSPLSAVIMCISRLETFHVSFSGAIIGLAMVRGRRKSMKEYMTDARIFDRTDERGVGVIEEV